ncbi:hypothetical protein CASFOL_040435 [Castilleja foliolosa]|uniref:J domain-containing protein n=1 Tax=Castilleja foliolosa TaxID=1961234 RepID=A0ABD3BBY9_9LAMI
MDNASHSLPIPKRSFNSNSNVAFSSHNKSVYDGVFGAGTPKLGLPTLAPRLEDYSEIFAGGLHASRTFSIPVLTIGDNDCSSIHFDGDSDYTEVFGVSGGRLAFASSFEDLVGQSTGGYDSSSDEPWSPAQSGSLSDEFDPVAGSDESLRSSDGDAHQSSETTTQFDTPDNKSSQSNIGTVLTGTTTKHVANCSALPGYTFSHYESPVSWDGEDDNYSVNVIDNLKGSTEEKQYTKCSANLAHNGLNAQRNDLNLLEKHGNSTSKPFMIVSDISLRTKPSQLPPPSRPPPALVVKKGDSDRSDSKPKTSKSYAFERGSDDSASLTLSPEGRENVNKSVKVDHDSTKEGIEIKDIRSHSTVPVEEKMLESHGKGIFDKRTADNYDGAVAWREETGYFEVIEKNISKQSFDIVEDCDLHKMVPDNIQQFGESERLQADHTETVEVLSEAKGNLNELDDKPKVKAYPEGTDIDKKFIDAHITKQNSGKHKLNIVWEEGQSGLVDVERAETRDQKLACEVEKVNERLVKTDIQEHKLVHERDIDIERIGDTSKAEDNSLRFKTASETEPIERNEYEKEVEWDMDSHVLIEEDRLKVLDEGCKIENNEGNGELKAEPNNIIYETGAGVHSQLVKGKSSGLSKSKNELQGGISHSVTNKNFESACLPDQATNLNICGSGKRVDVNGKKVEDASSVLKPSDDTLYSNKNTSSQKIERKDYNMKENLAAKGQNVGERIRREIELENEHIRKIEEEKEREREREKDRMAVDKAALEVRERSYGVAHDRTAVERATAEARQRMMAGARERLEKASMEAKLRAERAAVERATLEVRQRAAKKSMALHAASEAHDRVERSVPDRFPASFQYADMRQNSLPSDAHLQSAGISSSLRYSYSFGHAGADGESPQRCKARLERYRRTAERAANALAEKNRRDLLAQREREERNRVAEALDSEIKRWSSGKEANLRALLSTLQYILGPDSGWQPVPLTEVITTVAVRKAYRKATLCVHPDKLQQRGATIQQKYICEKVFDLLKEAWNKFNSEER